MKSQTNHQFSLEESQQFLDFSTHLFVVLDTDGTLFKTNSVTSPVLGWTPDELEGKAVTSFIHPLERDTTTTILKELFSGTRETIKDLRTRCLGKDGEYRWISWSAKIRDGKVYAVGGNVTHEVSYKQELVNHSLILDQIIEGVVIYDENYVIVYANQAEEQLFGYGPGELTGKGMMTLSHPQALKSDNTIDPEGAEKIKETGGWDGEWPNMHKDGSLIHTLFRVKAIQIAGRTHYICVHRDIREKKRTEEMVSLLTERLTLAVRAGKIGIWEWIPGTESLKWDKTTEEIYGFSPGTFPGTLAAYTSGIHPVDLEKHWQEVTRAIETKTSFFSEYRIVQQKQKTRWIQTSGTAIYDKDNNPTLMIGICQDITATKQVAEDQIFLGKISELLSVSFNYRETLQSMALAATDYFCDGCTIDFIHTDGSTERIIDVHPNEIEYKSVIASRLKGRERLLGTLTFFASPNSSKVFDERTTYLSEELAYRVSMALENSLLYQTSEEAVKARDQFLSIASHELKTPLTTLLLQNQMRERLLTKLAGEPFKAEESLKMLQADYHQIRRINLLLDDMLDISRIRGGQLHIAKENVEFNHFVNEVVERFRPQAEATGSKISVIKSKDLFVNVDAYRMEQVLINLLTNATKYGQGKPIKVEIQVSNARAKLFIHDEGRGISKNDLERIFFRFERAVSSNDVSGLGLGLYISREIVERHNGSLTAQSEPGKGSTFIVDLPL